MKQVLQNLKSGELSLEEVPPPALQGAGLRIRTAISLISAGTERMIIDLAQKSYVGKAQARPDLVRQVMDKAKKEGVLNTFRNVMSKLDRPLPLGYSAAGIVEEVGSQVTGFSVGDRVAMAGAGYANHAEINYVPKNLVVRIPDSVSMEEAAYTTVASIALQGVRNCKPELGEYVAVIGLGLIGLITVQLLKANGCRVIGIDLDETKVKLGLQLGMDEGVTSLSSDPVRQVDRFTSGRGVDHTLITASTKSDQPIELAGTLTRKQGRVTVVGAVGMNIPRDMYYKKELDIRVSMSYGPGRYDPSYEEGGIDYPYDFVRWTEQRNMEAVLDLMAQGQLNVKPLSTHGFPFEKALDAYDLIQNGESPYVGILLMYEIAKSQPAKVALDIPVALEPSGALKVGFAGAGNYASLHLLPHLKENPNVVLRTLVTATGLNAKQKAQRFNFRYGATNFNALIEDDESDAIFIATRHSTHADFTIRALEAGKHVFVEKPLVVSKEQLQDVFDAYALANRERQRALMVGLNRRFSPMAAKLRTFFDGTGAKQMMYRVNSGHIPTSSWLHNEEEGGGMLVGEMCHFIDLMMFICGETPIQVSAHSMKVDNETVANSDNVSITIAFSGGSLGTLCYNTVGDKALSKERFEVYGDGRVGILDDFRKLELSAGGKRSKVSSMNQDKGQANQIEEVVRAFRRSYAPMPFREIIQGMQVVFAAQDALKTRETISLTPLEKTADKAVV